MLWLLQKKRRLHHMDILSCKKDGVAFNVQLLQSGRNTSTTRLS